MQNYVGKQIDRYRIIERLGMGGMAVVYKAYDTRLERDVALKLIRVDAIPQEQHERLFKRFEREAKAHAKFDHNNIVHIYDYGEIDGSPYLVMSYLPGGTLKDRIHGPIDWQQAVRWLTPVVEALAYAHKAGVVHRDVKPANILFDENDQPILTDFGIAKVLDTNDFSLTGTGLGVGTPEYMAPEQWQGQPGPASDQYALGVVFYELIAGRKPYSADTPAAIAIIQATEPLTLPSEYAKEIPEAVEKSLLKALSRNPDDRYENIIDFSNALNNAFSLQEKNNLNLLEDTETIDSFGSENASTAQWPSYKPKTGKTNTHQNINSNQKHEDALTPGNKSKGTNPQITEAFEKNKKKRSGLIALLVSLGLIIFLVAISPSLISNLFNTSSQNNQRDNNEEKPTAPLVDETDEIISTDSENLATVTLTPTLLPTNTSESSNPIAEITGASVYLRAGPSVYHPESSGHLNRGEEVEILARDETGEWFFVLTKDSIVGWLYTGWIEFNFPVSAVEIADFIPTPPPRPVLPTAIPPKQSYP